MGLTRLKTMFCKMTRKEFKEKLFSYCEALGYKISESTVEFKNLGCIFYISKWDDNTISYVPIPSNSQKVTTMRLIKIQYNDSTLEIYKHIAKKWYMIYKEQQKKQKLEKIKKDFE